MDQARSQRALRSVTEGWNIDRVDGQEWYLKIDRKTASTAV